MKKHVNRGVGDDDAIPYDRETGIGEHKGVDRDDRHPHAPESAKYILLGRGKRLDLHPMAAERLPDAEIVFFVMEGSLKTDAILSTGAVAFGVPSVTLWPRRELTYFARGHLRGKTVFVVPDADWFENPQVERQALKARSHLRRAGVNAYVAAPPHDAVPYHKGVDDYLGAGGQLADLSVHGPEPDYSLLRDAVRGVRDGRTRRSAERVLETLILFADDAGELRADFPALKALLDIYRTEDVLPMLGEISHAFTVPAGSLTTRQEERAYYDHKRNEMATTVSTTFESVPTLRLREEYRAPAQLRLTIRDLVGRVDDHEHRLRAVEERLADLERSRN